MEVLSATFHIDEPQQIAGSSPSPTRALHFLPCFMPYPHLLRPERLQTTCWQCLDSNRTSCGGWHLQEKQGGLFCFRKMANNDREAGHPSSIFCDIRNIGSQHLAPNFTDKGSQTPFLSVNCALPPPFFTLTLFIHGPLPAASCKVFLL